MESLALAIDAKDPFTYGHVHRVRHYAAGLAKRLGITDEAHLNAIAFSALVHDMGKIAIPDAILKKPGKYSDREFAIMQTHAVIGSEMLRSIPLPYPVWKIVRHHHEKWNGRGYPDGLAGEEIPYEARILTVCDIYDAIRSTRPYRPKMPREKAIRIMQEEIGVSIDPRLGEVFLQHLDELERDLQMVESKILDIVRATNVSADFLEEPDPNAANGGERELTLYHNLTRLFSDNHELGRTLYDVALTIATTVPYSALVVYMPEPNRTHLYPALVHGLDADYLRDNRVRSGEGVSGWAFQNAMPMVTIPNGGELPPTIRRNVPFTKAASRRRFRS
ncbi:MAG: HD-GYP domain-containing protein [Deltaproteobacteria bacterium]|nr:HD-GYP domain-containing protein [Deltaproteobacteria bacterium]